MWVIAAAFFGWLGLMAWSVNKDRPSGPTRKWTGAEIGTVVVYLSSFVMLAFLWGRDAVAWHTVVWVPLGATFLYWVVARRH